MPLIPIASLAWLAWVVCTVEITVGMRLLLQPERMASQIGAVVLLLLFSLWLLIVLAMGGAADCGCGLVVLSVRGGLIRNVFLGIVHGLLGWSLWKKAHRSLSISVWMVFFILPWASQGADLPEVQVTPLELSFSAHVDELVLLRADVFSNRPLPLKSVRTTFTGHRMDRKLEQISPNQVRVHIAPVTWNSAEVTAELVLSIGDKKPILLPIHGVIRPWITVQPAAVSLGLIWPDKPKMQKVKLELTSEAAIWDWMAPEKLPTGVQLHRLDVAGGARIHAVELEIDENAMAEGKKAGTLLRETLLVQTNHPEMAEIRIPIVAAIARP